MAGDTKAIVAQFLQAWQRERDHKIKICLFGQPGAGKSSLITGGTEGGPGQPGHGYYPAGPDRGMS